MNAAPSAPTAAAARYRAAHPTEFFAWTSVFAPCASIKTLAFGPGEDYAEWLDWARKGLVRRPSDEALLELMLKGPFGTGRCLGLWGGLRTIGQMR